MSYTPTVQAPKNAPQLAITRRTRSTPFSSRVEDFGVQAYTIYNHMLLPTRIRGVEEDYFHLRNNVQLWDVSCQRQVELRGPDAARLAQLMTVRDLRKLEIGKCALAPVCDQDGFLLNDPWLHGTAKDGAQPAQFPGYQSDVLAWRAGAWLERVRAGKQPWFGVLSLEAPHPPYDAPAAGVARSDPAGWVLTENVPAHGDVEAKARRELSGYYAHIEATDRAIGSLLDTVAAEVVVVFTSVHGDMHGSHGLFRKGWPHEEAVRVPLLVRAPGVVPRRDDGAISLLDLSAMTRAWADGVDAIVERRHSVISMPSVVALPHQCDRVWRGLRTPQKKLVLDARGEPWLYFDLEQDPLEMNNLAGEPARRGEIAALSARVGRG